MRSSITFFLLLATASPVFSQEPAKKAGKIEPVAANLGRPVEFEKDIQPILDEKCVACHNVAIAESKLVLEDVPAILKGGKRGPALVAKDPDKSLIYNVAARALDPVMPPLPNKVSAAAFTPQELGLLRKWIEEGAVQGMGSGMTVVPWQAVPSTMNSIYSASLSTWGRWAAAGRDIVEINLVGSTDRKSVV